MDSSRYPALAQVLSALPKSYKLDIDKVDGNFLVVVTHPDAYNLLGGMGPHVVAYAEFYPDPKTGQLVPEHTEVARDHRRQGLATEMYRFAEKKLKKKIRPSRIQTDDAEKFWAQPGRPFGALAKVLAKKVKGPWTVEQIWSAMWSGTAPYPDSYYDLFPGYSKPENEDEECYYQDRAGAVEDAEDLIAKFGGLGNPVQIFRVLHVDKKEDIDLENLGEHWTIDAKQAVWLASHTLALAKPWFLIHATIPAKQVDWATTLRQQFNHPDEMEINLPRSAKPKVLKIEEVGKKKSKSALAQVLAGIPTRHDLEEMAAG
jgi:hypothetical protein